MQWVRSKKRLLEWKTSLKIATVFAILLYRLFLYMFLDYLLSFESKYSEAFQAIRGILHQLYYI